ncbi:hypothetical protein BJ322DRAFT_1082849 [Thelephora terrestris]|uniref:DUF6535 domain-containing protein n=1 Tax=Thelephora terrestris TaxID=56493 RepID=A0A9P6H6C7_9AGAM|nr:hypothetical protein BJ322DRAFT_1082849 [Thelephora terrestris]
MPCGRHERAYELRLPRGVTGVAPCPSHTCSSLTIMADANEISVEPRTPIGDGSGQQEDGPASINRSRSKRKRSRKGQNSSRPQSPVQSPPLTQDSEEIQTGNEGREEQNLRQPPDRENPGPLPSQVDYEARFYANYRKVAEEYDKDYLKKYGEDLDTTLIFAGLFSAVTSAFIIQVGSSLQSDPGDETAALLRVLIYKVDNTTFGDEVPPLPQWNGPPPAMVHVQAILFASFAASLLAALLAMLGKQWLNRYDSSDLRGSAVERGQNRQRKLDGLVAWYFHYVMESLPLMLQVALLLLGCALSRFLWEVSTIVASVVIGVTSIGVLFYLFIVIAGATFENCPYQTPASLALRYLGKTIPATIASASREVFKKFKVILEKFKVVLEKKFKGSFEIVFWKSAVIGVVLLVLDECGSYSTTPLIIVPTCLLLSPLALAFDFFHLGWAVVRTFVTLSTRTYHFARPIVGDFAIVLARLPQLLRRALHLWRTHATPEQIDQQASISDLRCILWTLQTSLDKDIRLSAVEHLTTKNKLASFDPTLVADPCFDVLISCVSIRGRKIAIMQDKEQLATASAKCFLRSIYHLLDMDPHSSVLVDIRRRYTRVFPLDLECSGLPLYSTMTEIHSLVARYHNPCDSWDDYRPSRQEHITFARCMVGVAQVEYQRRVCSKVPRWILRFALHSLFLDFPPPAPIVASCLAIAAIDLGCDVSNITTSAESTQLEPVLSLINQALEISIDLYPYGRDYKPITTILLFAASVEGVEPQSISGATLRAIGILRSRCRRTRVPAMQYITALLKEPSPPSLNLVIILAAPDVEWTKLSDDGDAVVRWATAVLAVPYTEEERPSFPPECLGRREKGAHPNVIRHIRGLGDLEILTSYFLLVWSTWCLPSSEAFDAMEISIREDFCGTGMGQHREDLKYSPA